MSRPAAALSLAAGCLMLHGCAWFDSWLPFSYSRTPLARAASRHGATRADVVRAAGNPRSVWMIRNGNGVCYNYFIEHGNDHREYFVVFDRAGVVTQYGFDSCMNADRKGTLQPAKGASR